MLLERVVDVCVGGSQDVLNELAKNPLNWVEGRRTDIIH